MEAWINPTATPPNAYSILEKNPISNDQRYIIYINSANKLSSIIKTGSQVTCASTTDVNTNQWNHVSGTYDGSNINVYVNGVLSGSCAQSGNIAGTDGSVHIGGYDAGTNFFSGTIDEPAIWNISLSADKIAEHAGAKVLDYSSYGNNGTYF